VTRAAGAQPLPRRENNKAHLNHWLLRDLLRADAVARERYAALKRQNAERARGDLGVYVAAKAALVAEPLGRARAERGLSPERTGSPTSSGPRGGRAAGEARTTSPASRAPSAESGGYSWLARKAATAREARYGKLTTLVT
jgi:hypothetical protein